MGGIIGAATRNTLARKKKICEGGRVSSAFQSGSGGGREATRTVTGRVALNGDFQPLLERRRLTQIRPLLEETGQDEFGDDERARETYKATKVLTKFKG